MRKTSLLHLIIACFLLTNCNKNATLESDPQTGKAIVIPTAISTPTLNPSTLPAISLDPTRPVSPTLTASPPTITRTVQQDISQMSGWIPSALEGDLQAAYPSSIKTERFVLHFTPGTYPDQNSRDVVDIVTKGLEHIETILDAQLDGSFDVYIAGSTFAPPDQSLRGRSFSADRRYFFLHDGTGNPDDQRYIATHELTHLFAWNVFGNPVSKMLSEGIAVYTGIELIRNSEHVPIDVFCAAYHQAGQLASISSSLSFEGHIRDLKNYHAAGCFVEYLISTYGPEKFGQLYPTGDYISVYGKSLLDLEQDWITNIKIKALTVPFDPGELVTTVNAVSSAYDQLFDGFQGTREQMAAYQKLDLARIALLEGRLEDSKTNLSELNHLLNNP